jgi:hypothetical protein
MENNWWRGTTTAREWVNRDVIRGGRDDWRTAV